MHYGRWYPTLVTLPDGDVLVASGVTKLVKPVYPDHPLNSGRNVVQTETFDVGCGRWSENGPLGERTLPTYPRMHLLPNGDVFYNAGGQAFRSLRVRLRHGAVERRRDRSGHAPWSDLAYAGLPLEAQSGRPRSPGLGAEPSLNPLVATVLTQTLQRPARDGRRGSDRAARSNSGAPSGSPSTPTRSPPRSAQAFAARRSPVMLPLEPTRAARIPRRGSSPPAACSAAPSSPVRAVISPPI